MIRRLATRIAATAIFCSFSAGFVASAQESTTWLGDASVLGNLSRAAAPVWSGNLVFKTVTPACAISASSFKLGDARKAFVRPIQIGQFPPAAMMVFPDGMFVGLPSSATQYGAIAVSGKMVALIISPTNKNKYSLKTTPAKVIASTPKIVVDGTFEYFNAVRGCTVRLQGTLLKMK
jgi:hypothetical protein